MKAIKIYLVALFLCFVTGVNAQTRSLDLGFITDITSIDLGLLNVGDVVNVSLKVLAPSLIIDPDISITLEGPTGQLRMNATVTPNEFDPTGTIQDIEIEFVAEQEGVLNNINVEINAYGSINRIAILGRIILN